MSVLSENNTFPVWNVELNIIYMRETGKTHIVALQIIRKMQLQLDATVLTTKVDKKI